jgi:hypothetical protein
MPRTPSVMQQPISIDDGKKKSRLASLWNILSRPEDVQFVSELDGPGQPMPVQVEIDPRTVDYNFGKNQNTSIDVGRDGVTFTQLRALAENCELLRGVIENKKNQISTLKYGFQLMDVEYKSPTKLKQEAKSNPQIKKAKEFFAKPDGINTFKQWVRMMIEELIVLDQLAVFPVKSLGGGPLWLRLLDGATIFKLIDKNGETPRTGVAYQQIIKGLVTHDFSMYGRDNEPDKLLLYHRNPRVWKHYGFSPVEQIIHIVNIALRRSAFQLSYYTEGNIPDMLIRVSAEWSDEQVAKYQRYFDLMLSGDLAQRRKIRFIPDALDPIYPQQDVLKDEFDEWLARLITYVLGASPNHFIRNLNRSVSESQREQADEEGLFSWMDTTKEVIDLLLHETLGLGDIEFVWIPNRSQDSLKQSEIDKIDVESGIRSIDEVRDEKGLPPIGMGNAVKTAHGYIALIEGEPNRLETIYTDIDKTGDEDDTTKPSTDSSKGKSKKTLQPVKDE